jgi:3-hydroxyacyl-CoA dehydrogenase/enoyl-CoA hydratase/3-hydroxybutyryl-CoA epimerase
MNLKLDAFTLTDHSRKYGEGIWELCFDLPGEKVNKFSRSVMQEFEKLVEYLEKNASQFQALVVTSGKPGIFIAGADIELIQATRTSEEATALSRAGQVLLDRWEDLPFPRIVASQGATS